MRPKKCILLIDSDEDRISLRRFLFETHGFSVLSAENARDAQRHFYPGVIDLVVCAYPSVGIDMERLLNLFKASRSWVPAVALVKDGEKVPVALLADASICLPSCSTADLIERIKIISARKRGPKKQLPVRIDAMMALAARRSA
jgi:two-component system, OmpR family, response regulator CpxR